MATDCGPGTITAGTGSKTISIGMTATWLDLIIQGTGLKKSTGFIHGGFQYAFSDDTTMTPVSKAIQVKNTSGTVVLEGTWTSFTGTNVIFNITTNTLGASQNVMLIFGN